MEDMTLQEEWLSTILAKSTRQSYIMSMKYFLEFSGLSKCEDIKALDKPETKRISGCPKAIDCTGPTRSKETEKVITL
jgi:hypothetical protein